MVDIIARSRLEQVLRPLAGRLQQVPPLAFTLLGFTFGLAAAGLAALGLYTPALGFWFGSRFLDALDGSVARLFGRQSDLGGYLDLLLDFVVYAIIPIALVLASPSELAYLTLALLLASFYINSASWLYLAALLEKRDRPFLPKQRNTSISMPSGLIEGAETILFYSLFFLFPQAFVPLAGLLAVLVLATAGQRLTWATRHL